MGKIKSTALLLIGAVIAVFIYENWVAAPYIKLFGRELIQLNISIIIIAVFFLGFVIGWLCCFSWNRNRHKKADLFSGEEKAPESQSPTQQEEK